jgi:hypothetical protein
VLSTWGHRDWLDLFAIARMRQLVLAAVRCGQKAVVDNDDPKKTRAYKKQTAENEPAESDEVGQALGALSSQLGAFLDEIKTQREIDNGERQTDRYRQWIVTRIELGIAALTLFVLGLTYGVYSKILNTENTQATIMANQAAIMDKQRDVANQQAADLARQLNDFETVQAANLVIEDFEPPYKVKKEGANPVFVFDSNLTVRNAGGTVASELNVEEFWRIDKRGIRVRSKEASLAPGKTRIVHLGVSSEEDEIAATSLRVEVTVSFLDVFKHPHVTAACLEFSPFYKQFISCETRHDHK